VEKVDITTSDGINLIVQGKPDLVIMDTAIEEPDRRVSEIDRINIANVKAANELVAHGCVVISKVFMLGNIDSLYSFSVVGRGRAHSGEVFIKFGKSKERVKWTASYVKSDGSISSYGLFMESVFNANLARGTSRKIIEDIPNGIPLVHRIILNTRFVMNNLKVIDEGVFKIFDDFNFDVVDVPDVKGVLTPKPVVPSSNRLTSSDCVTESPPASSGRVLIGFPKAKVTALEPSEFSFLQHYIFNVRNLKLDKEIQKEGAVFAIDPVGYMIKAHKHLLELSQVPGFSVGTGNFTSLLPTYSSGSSFVPISGTYGYAPPYSVQTSTYQPLNYASSSTISNPVGTITVSPTSSSGDNSVQEPKEFDFDGDS